MLSLKKPSTLLRILLLSLLFVFTGLFLYFFSWISFPFAQKCDFRVFSNYSWYCFINESQIFDLQLGDQQTFNKAVNEANENHSAVAFRLYRFVLTDVPQFQYKQSAPGNPTDVLLSFDIYRQKKNTFVSQLHITGKYKDTPPDGVVLSRLVSNLFALSLSESYKPVSDYYNPSENHKDAERMLMYFYEIPEEKLPIIVR